MESENQAPEVAIDTLAQIEQQYIMAIVGMFKGNKKQAAKTLGISLKTLYNKLNYYEKAEAANEVNKEQPE